jgi:hypothetical protein
VRIGRRAITTDNDSAPCREAISSRAFAGVRTADAVRWFAAPLDDAHAAAAWQQRLGQAGDATPTFYPAARGVFEPDEQFGEGPSAGFDRASVLRDGLVHRCTDRPRRDHGELPDELVAIHRSSLMVPAAY